MISTRNLSLLPDRRKLQKICKAISVMDAIMVPDWEFRYYSYQCSWGPDEEFFEMQDGSGTHLLILFQRDGCVINGFSNKAKPQEKSSLVFGLPKNFHEFIFGEPVASIGTTFCIWQKDENPWQVGNLLGAPDDMSNGLLAILDGDPQTYIDWAGDYFEDSGDTCDIPISVASMLYEGATLTRDLVRLIDPSIDDFERLTKDLKEIGYPISFG